MSGLLTVFCAIGGSGFLILVLSVIVGDIFDLLGFDFGLDASHDFGIFDSRVIGVFLTVFGGSGAIAALTGYGAGASSLAGLMGGVLFGAIVFGVGRFLLGQQSTSSVSAQDLLGRRAEVSVTIQPHSVGQIACLIGEERIERLARAVNNQELKIGQKVRIEAVTGEALIVRADDDAGYSLFSGKQP